MQIRYFLTLLVFFTLLNVLNLGAVNNYHKVYDNWRQFLEYLKKVEKGERNKWGKDYNFVIILGTLTGLCILTALITVPRGLSKIFKHYKYDKFTLPVYDKLLRFNANFDRLDNDDEIVVSMDGSETVSYYDMPIKEEFRKGVFYLGIGMGAIVVNGFTVAKLKSIANKNNL